MRVCKTLVKKKKNKQQYTIKKSQKLKNDYQCFNPSSGINKPETEKKRTTELIILASIAMYA